MEELTQLIFAETLLKEVSFLYVYTLFVEPRSHLAAGASALVVVIADLGHFGLIGERL